MASGVNHSRLISMTYPNGRVIDYTYATGLDSNISRLTAIKDGSTTLEEYSYLGLGTVVKRAHPEPGVDLTYVKQSGEGNGDAGDQYPGLDRFGRIVDQRWIVTSGGTHTDRFQYGFDRDSNRLYRDNLLDNNFDDLYHADGASNGYDSLNRLTDFRRGALSDANSDNIPDTVSTASRTQSWSMDAQGNFSSVTTDGNAQTRGHNAQNEITSVSGATTPTFDANGNLTKDETGQQPVWDAWNRMVKVKDSGDTTIATYTYDALSRRITENTGTARDIYFSAGWQVLEEQVSGIARVQYVWSAVYIDALIERDRDSDNNGSLEERLYVQQDANYNVTAVISTAGAVQERYVYDAYGAVTVLDGSWGSRSSSSYAWVYGWQGRPHDGTTGYVDFRIRPVSVTLGRPLSEDPIGFAAGYTSFYVWIGNNPVNGVDPLGLVEILPPSGGFSGSDLLGGRRGRSNGLGLPRMDEWLEGVKQTIQGGFGRIIDGGKDERNPLGGKKIEKPTLAEKAKVKLDDGEGDLLDFGIYYFLEPDLPMRDLMPLGGGIGGPAKGLGATRTLCGKVTQVGSKGYKSFDALKRGLGPAGNNKVWHHIVEQRGPNVQRFGEEAIHNAENVVAISKEANQAINAYYSSKQAFTKGLTVREWLGSQSFAKGLSG